MNTSTGELQKFQKKKARAEKVLLEHEVKRFIVGGGGRFGDCAACWEVYCTCYAYLNTFSNTVHT